MKVALVTGASRGLGAAIATTLGASGWAVAVNYAHDRRGGDRIASNIVSAGGRAAAIAFDVTSPDDVTSGIDTIAEVLGPVDLVVNNATGPQGAVPIMAQTWDLYQRHLEYFVKAPFLLLQATLPDWLARGSGRVINIGSEVVDVGSPYDAHYVAAKAAMIGLTRSWASELGPRGITVNTVSPGWTPVERHEGTSPEAYADYITGVPLGRMSVPSDVAEVVAFVASPAADFITGQNFSVNGGHTYR